MYMYCGVKYSLVCKKYILFLSSPAVGTKITEFLTDWSHKKDELSEKFKDIYNFSKPKSVGKGKGGKSKSQVVNHNAQGLCSYAADLMIELYLKVFTQWKEIALIIRKKEFSNDEEDAIDVFDLKCKEWGYLLRHTFGPRLGTGDYGHMVIDHASMLLRLHRSIGKMSNQGFEANHKIHRQLYAQASSHDSPGHAASLEQIITHQYSEELLFLRLCFRQAIVSIEKRTPFHFPGCQWKKSHKIVDWSSNDRTWIYKVDALFTAIFSHDTLRYQYQKKVLQDGSIKNGKCIVHPDDLPTFVYSRTSIKRHSIKRSPSIQRSLTKVPNFLSHVYCKLDPY
ncbi:uncharacterized protein LOC116289185 [Actinia tenebrosa]|uniref:Uncharacterized protein LOC116289185 n=1 Tax=Actinia tenebrosa TaxID=6105 RepID=A0A6P8HH56_ACTTE|nr:uncharacterized protein LOC116289185 [Actinia tenebrosa]